MVNNSLWRVLYILKMEADRYESENEFRVMRCFENAQALLDWLIQNKPEEELVFTHGDFCLPNIFAKGDEISSFFDLGRAGVADKYQDIAICYRSLKHNFEGKYGGQKYENFNPDILFEKLGMEPDWEKIRYYILLDELF